MPVLIDTGLLVALLDRNDRWHDWAVSRMRQLSPPFLTCEAVLTETAHLAAKAKVPQATISELLTRGFVQIGFGLDQHAESVGKLLQKYADLPMDLADACLVRMTELIDDSTVMTLNKDFLVYRRLGRQAITLIRPDDL